MTTDSLYGPPRARLRWAFREGLIIAGILLIWLGFAVLLMGLLTLLGLAFHVVGIRAFHLLADLLQRSALLWPAFASVAFLTTGLYVVVRAGTLLIDHQQRGLD